MKHALRILALLQLMSMHPAYAQIFPDVELRQQRLEEVRLTRSALSRLQIQEQLLVLEWLSLDCAVGNEGLERQIKAAGQGLEAAFLESYTLGPMKADLVGNEEILRRQYNDIQAVIKESGSTLFGEDMARLLMGISQEEYVRRELERQRIAYQSSALTGLGLVGSKGKIGDLKRIAETTQEPIAISAQEAIRAIEEREMPR
jgi:hypothetical protein